MTVSRTCGVNMPLLRTCVILVIFSGVMSAGGSDMSCQKLRIMMDKKSHSILPKESHSVGRRPCGKEGRTCCSVEVEDILTTETRKELVAAAKADMNQLYSLLSTRVRRFNDFFTTLLLASKKDFDDMFKATYGIVYEQNAYLFTDLFEELERYYSKGQVDLEKAMENFFSTLYQKMFTVLNGQYQFDETYLLCAGNHMKDLKPFGDVPQKLSVQIKRSFVATRTFAQALNVAKDVVLNMQNLGPAGDCSQALMRMSNCQYCRDVSDAKPCSGLCLNVMKGCLAYHSELDLEWNHFIDSLDRVIVRLLGPFNIENVVEPIDIKISEAIMNFQENSQEISEKVFNGCGRPKLSRRVRDTSEIGIGTYQFSRKEPQMHPSIEKLMREIRMKAKESRGFWGNLPYRICNNMGGDSKENNHQCWNGTHVARYTRGIIGNGLNAQTSNPEVSIDTTRPKHLLNEQITILKMLTSKLKDAHNGQGVDWVDIEEIGSSRGAVGSGDGSGDDDLSSEGSGRDSDTYDDNEKGDDDPVDGILPGPPVSPNNESNIIPVGPKLIPTPPHVPAGRPTSRASTHTDFGVLRVVTAYVFPIYVIWLGGLFSDWL